MGLLVIGETAELATRGCVRSHAFAPLMPCRFDAIGVENTEETRRAYRELLFTTPGQFLLLGQYCGNLSHAS